MKQKSLLLLILLFAGFSMQSLAQWVPTPGPYPQDVKQVYQKGVYLCALTDSSSVSRVAFSSNYGYTWKNFYNTINYKFKSIGMKGGVIMACNDTGVFRSNNKGATWIPSDTFLTSLQTEAINSLQMLGNTAYLLTTKGVYKSINISGTMWDTVSTTWTSDVLSIAVNGLAIYVGTRNDGIYRSLDGGLTWSNYYAGQLLDVNAVSVFQGKVFAGTSAGLYYSVNDGVMWTLSNINNDISSFCIKGIDIFASCSDGNGVLMYTSDTNFTWKTVNTGLANTVVNSLTVGDTFLYAATADRVWKRPLNQLITYNIKLTANPPNGGVLTGAGTYPYATDKVVIATPNINWEFKEWTENGSIVLLDSMCTISLFDDYDWTANFNLVNGIENTNSENLIQVYPNPAQEEVVLKTKASWIGKSFFIIDASGKIVVEGIIENDATPISLQGLSVGHYFLKVNNEFTQGFKLLKR